MYEDRDCIIWTWNQFPSFKCLLCSVNFFLPILCLPIHNNNWWWDRFLKHEIRGKGGNTFRKLLDLNIGCNSCAHKYIIWKNKNWRLYVFLFLLPSQKSWTLKFGFSEKATNFGKNLRHTFDNSVLVKKSTKIFQNKCGQVVLYKLYQAILKIKFSVAFFGH